MTTFAKLIEELDCPKVFPSTSPRYKEILVFKASTAKGIKPDGTAEDIPGKYWPISRADHTIVAQWNRSEFYASRYAITEPIRHWIISAGNQCFLMEQSPNVPEILHVCAIDINVSTPTFRGGASIDIREQYPVRTSGWTTYISDYFMALFIRAITITTKMHLNSQTGIDYPKFYNLHGVSATEETFLRFIDVEFGLNAVMCNLIADWLDGAMAGFIMTSQVVTLEKEDIVIEQMPRATDIFFSDNTIILDRIAAIKHKHAKAQRIAELKPVRDATNALLRELLEKKLAGSVLAQYLQDISIIKDTDTDFDPEAVKKELAAMHADTAVMVGAKMASVDKSNEIECELQQLRQVVTEMNKIMRAKAHDICSNVAEIRRMIISGDRPIICAVEPELEQITIIAESIKRACDENSNKGMLD